MKITKKKNGHYLLVKLNARNRKYLNGYQKHTSAKVAKDADKYFSDMISIHTKALFVMETAMLLESEQKIKSDAVDSVFNELDKALRHYEKVIDKYFARLGNLLDRRSKKKTLRAKR